MKKSFCAVSILISVFMVCSVCAAADYKLGFVDIQKAVTESLAGKAANDRFTEEAEKMKDDILKEKESIEKLGEVLQKQSMMLTDDVRREKEKDFLRRQRDYERQVKDSKTELQIKEAELTNDILEKLLPVVKKFGKDNGFSIIFEKSERMVLYADDALDLTDKIIAIYDAQYRKKQ